MSSTRNHRLGHTTTGVYDKVNKSPGGVERLYGRISPLIMSSSMQQRKAEILAKRAKLAELKRQRELRQHEFSQGKVSSGDGSEVRCFPLLDKTKTAVSDIDYSGVYRSSLRFPVAPIVEPSSMT